MEAQDLRKKEKKTLHGHRAYDSPDSALKTPRVPF